MIPSELLAILCCPETKQDLTVADAPLIEKINGKIAKRELKTRSGGVVSQKIEGGLVRTDRQFLYVVREGIPVMLIDEAIPLTGFL